MYQIKYDKIKVTGLYMGVEFANSIGVTKSKYLAEKHKSKGATITTLPANSSMGQMTKEG